MEELHLPINLLFIDLLFLNTLLVEAVLHKCLDKVPLNTLLNIHNILNNIIKTPVLLIYQVLTLLTQCILKIQVYTDLIVPIIILQSDLTLLLLILQVEESKGLLNLNHPHIKCNNNPTDNLLYINTPRLLIINPILHKMLNPLL